MLFVNGEDRGARAESATEDCCIIINKSKIGLGGRGRVSLYCDDDMTTAGVSQCRSQGEEPRQRVMSTVEY
jgi:hypothetical protein